MARDGNYLVPHGATEIQASDGIIFVSDPRQGQATRLIAPPG